MKNSSLFERMYTLYYAMVSLDEQHKNDRNNVNNNSFYPDIFKDNM